MTTNTNDKNAFATEEEGGDVTGELGRFAMIPEWLFLRRPSANAIALYGLMAVTWMDRKDRTCFPSKRAMREALGVSEGTLERAMRELVELGAVRVTPRIRADGSRSANDYYLAWTEPDRRGAKGEGGGATGDRRRSRGRGITGEGAITRVITPNENEEPNGSYASAAQAAPATGSRVVSTSSIGAESGRAASAGWSASRIEPPTAAARAL